MARPTVAIIDRQALRDNFMLAQSLAPDSQSMPMVKANAYGHGALEVCGALADMAPAFGVACIEEAIALREAGVKQPILLLEGTFSKDEVAIAAQNDFWLMVENTDQKEAVLTASIDRPVIVWLGVDTGMHRLGFQPGEINTHFNELKTSNNVAETMVIASHFACADDLQSKATDEQLECFDQSVSSLDIELRTCFFSGQLRWDSSLAKKLQKLATSRLHALWQLPLLSQSRERRSAQACNDL